VSTVVLPGDWLHHAAPAAPLFDPLGPPIVFWTVAALLLAAAILFVESRPSLSLFLALLSAPPLAIAANGLVDDAYIQFRYAENLASGQGPVFNPGERIEGASGGVWIGILALVSRLSGADAARGGRLASLLVACVAAVAAARFGEAIAGRRGAARAAILWASLPTTALYAATGLETAAFGCALWCLATAVTRDRQGPAAAAAALAATLRPEGVVLLAGAAPFWRGLGRAGRAALVGGCVGAAAIAAGRLAYYGLPVPRSALVKGVIAPAGFVSGLRYLGRAAFEWWPLLAAVLWTGRRRRALVPVYVSLALWTGLVVARGGDWMPGGRYLLPVVVLLAAAVVAIPSARTARLVLIGSVVWSLVLLMPCSFGLDRSSNVVGSLWRAMAEHRAQSRWWEGIGAWLREHAPEQTLLATGPAGALPYAARLRTFDLYGLCSPVGHRGEGEAGHRLWGLQEGVTAGAQVLYPGRELLLVEGEAVLPASLRTVSDEENPLRDYRRLTIVHPQEYRFDFIRDTLWVRNDFTTRTTRRRESPAYGPEDSAASAPERGSRVRPLRRRTGTSNRR
jgi:arabinofuranosyltransferase